MFQKTPSQQRKDLPLRPRSKTNHSLCKDYLVTQSVVVADDESTNLRATPHTCDVGTLGMPDMRRLLVGTKRLRCVS